MSTGSVGKSVRTAFNATSNWGTPSLSSFTLKKLISSNSIIKSFNCSNCNQFSSIYKRSYSSYPTNHSSNVPTTQTSLPSSFPRRKRTILDLHGLKRKGIPITVLTAHDYPSARFIESSYSIPSSNKNTPFLSTSTTTTSATTTTTSPVVPIKPRGIDVCLVGDSLAMVACGYKSTTSLTLAEMLYHCRSVARGCSTSLLIADMPFGTYTVSTSEGISNAVRIIQEGNMDGVKVEGGEEIVKLVEGLVKGGIAVMGHVGLTPQRHAQLSGFRVQGKNVDSAMRVWRDAKAIEKAGAFAIVVEAVPSRLAEFISKSLKIPTIGIGAGIGCDGQVLVQLDMLGVTSLAKGPKFLKKFAELEGEAIQAIGNYVEEVREKTFPEEKHGYAMEDSEWEGFLKAVQKEV